MLATPVFILGVLFTLCLQLSFVHCVQPRLNVTEHDILKTLFDSTGGSSGRWNYASMGGCLTDVVIPSLIGREWNFAKNAAGAYLDDPCQNDATFTKPFMGVNCSCNAVSCRLRDLILPCGDLSGPLPLQLGNLDNLMTLALFTNSLTGPIQNSLGKLAKLQNLDLSANSLTGSIPGELGRLNLLQQLILSNNTLTGSIPPELAYFTSLNVLLLQNNSLTTSSASKNAFSFIRPQTFTQLTALDVSNNELTGTIPESIFKLPALQVFSAGANCFSGFLPGNICNATNLNTIAISGLSTAKPCNRYYWKDTVFSSTFGFSGFSAKHFIKGSLPQCIYSMPSMVTIHAAGNYFLGEAPFSGVDKSGLKISPLLRDINLARNRLSGTISQQLVTAARSTGELISLDMSYNRIGGNLDMFSGNSEAFVSNASPLALKLEVNHLSGDISAPLLPLKHIKILSGNVFWCSYSRNDLPVYDYPTVESYQCDSSRLNNMLIAFGVIVIIIFTVIQVIRHKQKVQHYVGIMKLWLDVADGRRAIDKDIQITHMKRYSDYFRDLRYFVLIIGLAMIVVLIVYVSLAGQETRTVTDAYAWVTTAAYLSGETSTILLMDICICMTGLTWYLITENKWEAISSRVRYGEVSFLKKASIHTNKVGEEESCWTSLRLLPLLRVLILIVLIWGVLIAGNVLYLQILLNGTPDEQETFKFAFAAFKLVWTMSVTNRLFFSKFLYFGVEEEHHNAFIILLGGKERIMFMLNVVSYFWIPLLTIIVIRPECFHDALVAADPVSVEYGYDYCTSAYNLTTGKCSPENTFTQIVYSTLDVPFAYDFTCSPSILRAYIPLYQEMFLFLIVRSALQLCYFCTDIEESEHVITKQKPEESSGVMSIVTCCSDRLKSLVLAGIIVSMPTKHLMYNSNQRQALHKVGDERVFSAEPSVWITKAIPAHLGVLVILLTFAVLAPLLALSIILYMLLETYVSQMVLGRFLVTQLGIVLEYKRANGYNNRVNPTPNAIFVSPNKRARIRQDIEDATQPWGALAVLKEVEAQCRHMPASAVDIGRSIFLIAPAITMAFTVNDVFNNDRDDHKYWPSALLLCLALALEVLSIAYDKYYAAHKHSENNQELSEQIDKEKKEKDESRTVIELPSMSNVPELEMNTRASDANRYLSWLDWDEENSPEVRPANNEQGKESANPIHAKL